MGGHWGPHFSLGGRGPPGNRRTAPAVLSVFLVFTSLYFVFFCVLPEWQINILTRLFLGRKRSVSPRGSTV